MFKRNNTFTHCYVIRETGWPCDAKADLIQIHSAGSSWLQIVDGYLCIDQINAGADLAISVKPL